MGGITKRRVGGVAVAGMVIAGLGAVSSMSASGAGPDEATQPLYTPYGTLTVNLTDRDGTYTLTGPGSEVPEPETIVTSQPCAAVDPNSGELLVLAPNPDSATNAFDTVQIRDSGLGVNTGNTSCGSSAAALISGAEQLKIELGGILPDDVYIESAIVNWTQNKSGDLTYLLEGGQTSTTNVGRNAPPQQTVAAAAFDDQGNVRVLDRADLFRSITFSSNAKRDNEGISVVNGTTFNLVQLDPNFEVAVFCGEQVTETGDGGVADSVVFLRGQNEEKDGVVLDCEDVGVVVEVLPGTDFDDGRGRVFWDNSFEGVSGTPQNVQGTVTIKWAPVFVEGKTQAQIEEILDREIDYDADGPALFTDTLWCLSFTNESNFELPQAEVPTGQPTAPGANDDGSAPWCLVEDNRKLSEAVNPATGLSEPAIIQTEVLAGKGDPWRL